MIDSGVSRGAGRAVVPPRRPLRISITAALAGLLLAVPLGPAAATPAEPGHHRGGDAGGEECSAPEGAVIGPVCVEINGVGSNVVGDRESPDACLCLPE